MSHSLLPTLHWLSWNKIIELLQAAILLIVGIFLARAASNLSIKALAERIPLHQQQLVVRIVFYAVLMLFVVSALQHLGFELSVLLGAAGLVTVALGFAAQTSVSNIISGLFLIAEQPFVIGDSINANGITGEVLAIDLLSIKIRTDDNTYVRVPNETLIKANIINLTRFPIRRFDLALAVAYKKDLSKVREVLLDIADKNLLCLEEPKPVITILGLTSAATNLQFSVWATQKNFSALKNSIQEEIKKAFAENNIEIA